MAQSTKPNILVIWGDDIGIWRLQFVLVGRLGRQQQPLSLIIV